MFLVRQDVYNHCKRHDHQPNVSPHRYESVRVSNELAFLMNRFFYINKNPPKRCPKYLGVCNDLNNTFCLGELIHSSSHHTISHKPDLNASPSTKYALQHEKKKLNYIFLHIFSSIISNVVTKYHVFIVWFCCNMKMGVNYFILNVINVPKKVDYRKIIEIMKTILFEEWKSFTHFENKISIEMYILNKNNWNKNSDWIASKKIVWA